VDPRPTAAYLSAALARGDWKAADETTRALLVQAAGLDPPVGPAQIAGLPLALLVDIDSRWSASSGAVLGFAVQSRVWVELDGPARVLAFEDMSFDDKMALGGVERRFAARVGWKSAERGWTGPDYASEAPRAPGALPYLPLMCSYGLGLVGLNLAALASRFDEGRRAGSAR
jgi:hypothetical protein